MAIEIPTNLTPELGPFAWLLGTWEGTGTMWRRAWVNAVERLDVQGPEPYRLLHAHGTGVIIQGAPEWTDYAVEAELTSPLARSFGLAARVQGLRRHYTLLLVPGGVELRKSGPDTRILAHSPLNWTSGQPQLLRLEVHGPSIRCFVNKTLVLRADDHLAPLLCGGVALVVEEGWLSGGEVRVQSLQASPQRGHLG